MNLLFLLIGLTFLIIGAEAVIRGSVSIGKKLNVSLFVIGIVIVAGGTSLPELASSISAVISGHSNLALGAVVGSNIANLILIMASTTLLVPISNINKNQINQASLNIFLAIVLILMGILSISFNYFFGLVAVLSLSIIMFFQFKKSDHNIDDVDEKASYSLFVSTVFIILGIVLLIYGSSLFVSSAINIATYLNIPESIVGISIVAFGTSLPELVVGIMSALKRRIDFALGNILGSNIYNVLGVLGISSFFGDFKMPISLVTQDLIFMLFVTLLILIVMLFMRRIGRSYGILGILLYISYIFYIYN
tara:strand:- start:320 stop:1240 length:921 start_codon:yes stop_codon:yes gene_type:complete